MKIIAAVLDQIGAKGPFAQTRSLRLAELELQAPRPGELLVRIDAAGLCHSDRSVVNGDRPRPMPMALGHEASATVVEAGDPDGAFAPGDRVVLAFLPPAASAPPAAPARATCASLPPRPTARAGCCGAAGGCTKVTASCSTTWASPPSPPTR